LTTRSIKSRKMGNAQTSNGLKKQSTALEVISFYSDGKVDGYLDGKVAVVTGGNSGIGLETVKSLASAGCRVIMGSRSVEAGLASIDKEVKQLGDGNYLVTDVSNIIVKQLDLESLKSIETFATDVLSEPKIDFLILNAGVMMIPNAEYTKNGWEKQIGINHYGHFYLTSLLKEKMASQKEPSRIVAVSSSAHTLGEVIPSDVHFKNGRKYSGVTSYGQSKLANILFAKSLADELKDTHVRTVSLHPGVIATNLVRHLNSFLKVVVKVFLTDKSIPQGASTTLYGCLCPDFEKQELSGSYLSDCAILAPNEVYI
jgi:NAD(P)-dependent dehydrogenase (short-subunit alcohol dehydrogenase family)